MAQLLGGAGARGVLAGDAEVGLAQLVHEFADEVRGVGEDAGAYRKAWGGGPVVQSPGAEGDHHGEGLDAGLGEGVAPPLAVPGGVVAGEQARPDEPAQAGGEDVGGDAFHFLDATPEEALARALELAGGLDVRIGGGPTTVRQFLAADLVDFLHLVTVPLTLGAGVSLWEGLAGVEDRFTVESVTSASGLTHQFWNRVTSG
ncbi:hypothetical protein B9W68_28370 [Streptomyces sp. CS227]|nr:hypothetical protein B9W68_28370 [Streptomyces sp. CS227]